MPGGNNRGPLSPSLTIGRGKMSGPQLGGYVMFHGHVNALTSASEILNIGWIMPFEFRLQSVGIFVRDITVGGATTLTWQLYRHASAFQTSGATALLSPGPTETTNASGRVAAVATEDCIGSTTSLILRAQRAIPRLTRVFFGMSTNAGTISDIDVQVVGIVRGHASSDRTDD